MRAAKVVLESTGSQKDRLMEALSYEKQQKTEQKAYTFFNMGDYKKPGFLRIVIVWFEISRFIHKALYFYLFPYLVLPLSYTLHDGTKTEPLNHDELRPPPGWPAGYKWPPVNYNPNDWANI